MEQKIGGMTEANHAKLAEERSLAADQMLQEVARRNAKPIEMGVCEWWKVRLILQGGSDIVFHSNDYAHIELLRREWHDNQFQSGKITILGYEKTPIIERLQIDIPANQITAIVVVDAPQFVQPFVPKSLEDVASGKEKMT